MQGLVAGLLFALAGIACAAPKPGVNDCGRPFGKCFGHGKEITERAANQPPPPAVDGTMTAFGGDDDGIMTAFKRDDDGIMTAFAPQPTQ